MDHYSGRLWNPSPIGLVILTSMENEQLVNLNDLKSRFVVLKMQAAWCGPCKMYAPTFETAKGNLENENIRFYSVDVDENVEIPATFNVKGVPTTILYDTQNKVELWRAVGVTDYDTLAEAVKQHAVV